MTIPTTQLGRAIEHITDSLESDMSKITVRTVVPQVDHGNHKDQSIRKSLTLTMVSEVYPSGSWTRIYTNGSVTASLEIWELVSSPNTPLAREKHNMQPPENTVATTEQ